MMSVGRLAAFVLGWSGTDVGQNPGKVVVSLALGPSGTLDS